MSFVTNIVSFRVICAVLSFPIVLYDWHPKQMERALAKQMDATLVNISAKTPLESLFDYGQTLACQIMVCSSFCVTVF